MFLAAAKIKIDQDNDSAEENGNPGVMLFYQGPGGKIPDNPGQIVKDQCDMNHDRTGRSQFSGVPPFLEFIHKTQPPVCQAGFRVNENYLDDNNRSAGEKGRQVGGGGKADGFLPE